jgi:hypothetical protein
MSQPPLIRLQADRIRGPFPSPPPKPPIDRSYQACGLRSYDLANNDNPNCLVEPESTSTIRKFDDPTEVLDLHLRFQFGG